MLVGFCAIVAGCAADTPAADRARHTGGSSSDAPGVTGGSGGGTGQANSTGLIVPTGGASAAHAVPAPTSGGETCASGMQNTSPVTPTVWLVIDGSSSMNQPFEGGSSRWLSLRSNLMDPGGLVDALQSLVRFGMVIYSGGDPTHCVQLVTVDPALDNHDSLAAQYPMTPLGMGTPTDKALDYVVNELPVLNTGTLDATSGPVYVVLATDGQPNDNCGGDGLRGGGANVEQHVVDIAADGTANGMQMFVISLAGGDNRLQAHLETVAAATASQTPPFVPATQDELIAAFQKIVGGASCLVSLDGTVQTGKECTGSVQLNSQPLTCNAADGWKLFNESTVQLTGKACQTFLDHQSMVTASFPCEVFSPN